MGDRQREASFRKCEAVGVQRRLRVVTPLPMKGWACPVFPPLESRPTSGPQSKEGDEE